MSNGLFDEDPNTKLTGLETLLGTVTIPALAKNRKQLIDAAILASSLELLKPKQQGENFASQASRALGAGMDFGKNYMDYVSSLPKSSIRPQVTVTAAKIYAFNNVAKNLYDNNEKFRNQVKALTGGGLFDFNSPVIKALAGNAISYQSEYGGTIENAIINSGNRMFELTGSESIDTDNKNINPIGRRVKTDSIIPIVKPDISKIKID
jgi:hypothetical protein